MTSISTTAQRGIKMPPVRVRQIAFPTEHGGWGFLFEPIVAGMAISFSIGGIWIAIMIVGAFLMRQPLKIFVLDRMGIRDNRRASVAAKYLLLYMAVGVAGVIGAMLTSNTLAFVPIICVLPLAAIQNYYDVFRRSRHIVPELAGAVAISASVASIALAGGFRVENAIALWVIFLLRLLPSIIYVRQRLLLEKGKEFSWAIPFVLHILAVVVVFLLAWFELASVLTVVAMIVLLYRAIAGLSKSRKIMKAMQIGMFEVGYGALVVLSVVLGHFLGF